MSKSTEPENNWATPFQELGNLRFELEFNQRKQAQAEHDAGAYSRRILELNDKIKKHEQFYKLVPDPETVVRDLLKTLDKAVSLIGAYASYTEREDGEMGFPDAVADIRRTYSETKRLLKD